MILGLAVLAEHLDLWQTDTRWRQVPC